LETLSLVQIVMYKKESSSLQLTSQCDLSKTYRTITNDLDKIAVGLKVVELIDKISHEEESNPLIFKLILDVLEALDKNTKNLQNIFYLFEIRLNELLGYKINFDRCGICRKNIYENINKLNEIVFDFSKGSPLCSSCVEFALYPVNISIQNSKILHRLESLKDFDATDNIVVGSQSSYDIRKFLFDYLRYHISGLKDLKSVKIFDKII
jgi:DNA repair protein RecO (recombination protein O)